METIFRGGEHRVLANLPRSVPVGQATFAPHYESQFKLLPRSQWQPLTSNGEIKECIDRLAAKVPTEDQDGIGACGAGACYTAINHCRVRNGQQYAALALGRLYHLSGGGSDNGSQLSENLRYAMGCGIPRRTDREQELDYRSQWTAAETEEAKGFRILGAVDCPTFDHLASAIQGPCDAVEHGILCGSNYDVDDSGLWIRTQRGKSGGHAQCTPAGGLCYVDGVWGLLVHGTWGTEFGYKGFYVVPQCYFVNTPFSDGWGVYSVVAD